MWLSFFIPSIYQPFSLEVVEYYQTISIQLPEKQLAHRSLQVTANKSWDRWSEKDHSNSFYALRKTAALWEKQGFTNQYLVYGKQQLDREKPFSWEIVPFHKTNHVVARIWQQCLFFFRVVFGGFSLTGDQRVKQREDYKQDFSSYEVEEEISTIVEGQDAFCQSTVIEKQSVLEGRTIRVLYNYAPIGLGDEKLHFLFVPKAHKVKFSELTEEEYLETTKLVQKIMTHFSQTRSVQSVYLFHKTGVDTGQTVPHWHMHIIFSTGVSQDLFGKLTVLKNMLLRSSPMKDNDLKKQVDAYKMELVRG